MKPAWRWDELEDGSGSPWLEYSLPPFEFVLDTHDNKYRAFVFLGCNELPLGPPRKTRQAAHNDLLKWAKRTRALLVVLGRAKLPNA